MDAVVFDDALTSPDPSGPGESRFAPPDGARAYWLPGGVLLLDVAAGLSMGGASGDVLSDGAPLPRPSCTLLLGPAGASRRLTVARHPELASRRGAPGTAPFDAALSTAPDFIRATGGLPGVERLRLLRFLAGTCAPVLRVAGHPGFASLLHAMARGLVPAAEPGARPLTQRRRHPSVALGHAGRGGRRRVAPPHAAARRADRRPGRRDPTPRRS